MMERHYRAGGWAAWALTALAAIACEPPEVAPMDGATGDASVARDAEDMRVDGAVDPGPDAEAPTGGPRILSASASAARITEGETVRFNAVVTHPEGLGSLLGGTVSSDGTTLGSMTADGPGTYSLDVSWEAMHAATAIELDAPLSRAFELTFFDAEGRTASERVSVELHCDGAGGSACGGACTDLQADAANCGACGNDCAIADRVTGCSRGSCVTLQGTRSVESCADTCGRAGYACGNLCAFTTLCSGICSGEDRSDYLDQENFEVLRPGDEAGFFSYYALLSRSGNNWQTRDTMSCDTVPAAALGGLNHDVSVCCCEVDAAAPAPRILSVDEDVVPHGTGLALTGAVFGGATDVTIGGVSVSFTASSASRIVVAQVPDTVPVGAQSVVVTTPAGASAPFAITVLHLVIAEVDADTDGRDDQEFVEIDTGVAGVDLRDFVLVLYNGATGSSDEVWRLDATSDAAGRVLLGNARVASADLTIRDAAIQNGPDALALYRARPSEFPVGTAIRADPIDAVIWDTDDPDSATLLSALLGAGPEAVQINENANGTRLTDSVTRCGAARNDGRAWRAAAMTPDATNACP